MRVESLRTIYSINNFTQAAPTCMPIFLESTGYSKGSLWPCLFWVLRVWLFISELWLFGLLISCLCFSSWSFGWAFTSVPHQTWDHSVPVFDMMSPLGAGSFPYLIGKSVRSWKRQRLAWYCQERWFRLRVGLALSLSVLAVHISHSGEASD